MNKLPSEYLARKLQCRRYRIIHVRVCISAQTPAEQYAGSIQGKLTVILINPAVLLVVHRIIRLFSRSETVRVFIRDDGMGLPAVL